MDNNNMRIWRQVETSDPASLKKVSIGRTFTAIDPQHQIMKATEVFGPVGEGWGWHATTEVHHTHDGRMFVIANVTVWHGDRGNEFGPFPGCRGNLYAPDKHGKWKANDDAPKMAVTDGLTKALSHLGFNADVFLGKHDGNKYSDSAPGAASKEDF